MDKKCIKAIVMTIVTSVLLFVVSYAWFEGDYRDKKINGTDVNVSASNDLILSYKGSVYTSLNLSDIISKEFEFGQVSSTGLYGAKYYKIDYEKELDNLPAEYTEAVPNEDYLEFNIKITASDSPKRVYLDGVNSGFQNVLQDFGAYNGIRPADCMRCSINFTDTDTATNRTIILANSGITSYESSSNVNLYNACIQENDLVTYAKDGSGKDIKTKPLYVSGQPQYDKKVVPITGEEAYAVPTGIQVPTFFTDLDFSSVGEGNMSNQNQILFDLRAYQEKNITIRIWLEGSTIPETEDSLTYIAGQDITFALKFASSTDQSVEYKVKYVEPGMEITSINDYISRTGENYFSKIIFDAQSTNYRLKNYVRSGNNLIVTYENKDYTYTLDSTTGYYVCKDKAFDKLYYNITTQAAYVPYAILKWKLINNVKKRDLNGVKTNVTIAHIDGTNNIEIPNSKSNTGSTIYDVPIEGEFFSLIGYYEGVFESKTVVNELFLTNEVSITNQKVFTLTNDMAEENVFSASVEQIIAKVHNDDASIYYFDDYFNYVDNGDVKAVDYSYKNLNWRIDANDGDISLINNQLTISNFADKKSSYVDGSGKVYDYVFNLTGSINKEGRTYDIINILVDINNAD